MCYFNGIPYKQSIVVGITNANISLYYFVFVRLPTKQKKKIIHSNYSYFYVAPMLNVSCDKINKAVELKTKRNKPKANYKKKRNTYFYLYLL